MNKKPSCFSDNVAYLNPLKILLLILSISYAFINPIHGFISYPLINHFIDKEYKAKFQNWDIDEDDTGFLYFANNKGLLQYDGFNWDLKELPSQSNLRSVFCDNDKIYVGSFEEFGFFRRNLIGDLEYFSLSTQLKGKFNLDNEEIWRIYKWKDFILFQSFSRVYRYNPSKDSIEIIEDKINSELMNENNIMLPLFCYPIGDELFAQGRDGNFYIYKPEGWKLYWDKKSLGSYIMGIIPPESYENINGIPEGSLVFTQEGKFYKIKNNRLLPQATEIDEALHGTQINRIISIKDSTLYIGTIGKGLYHITSNGKLLEHFDATNGLGNNTILGLKIDKEKNLWIALDDGISILHLGIPIEVFNPMIKDTYQNTGTIYGVGKHKGTLFWITNQGAFTFNEKQDIIPIEQSKGQNWFIETFDGQTFIGGSDQTVVLGDKDELTTYPFSGTDIKKCTIHGQEILLQSTYFTLEIFKKNDKGKWMYSHTVTGLEAPVRQIEIDADGTIWASHWTKGLYKLLLSTDLKEITSKKFYPSLLGNLPSKQIYIMKVRGKTVFSEGKGIFDFDEETNKFNKSSRFGILNLIENIRDTYVLDDNNFWLLCLNDYKLINYDGKAYSVKYSIPLSLFPRSNNGENSSIFINDGKIYFTSNDLIGIFPLNRIESVPDLYPLSIKKAGSYNKYGIFERMNIEADTPHISSNDNFTIYLNKPSHNETALKYHFRLTDGRHVMDSISSYPYITYPELSWGNHFFKCDLIDDNENVIKSIDYKFYVKRPWPFRWWMILIYILILSGIIFYISKYIARKRLKRQTEAFEKAQADQNNKIREQSLLIAQQEKLLLEKELSAKSKELASMAFGAYGRQQALDNMKASLVDLKKKGSDISIAEKVLAEFERNQNDSTAFWSVFEKNFDLIHEHFFRNLRNKFPSLTDADMKFCALLRMNMSTKEMSRFTNLSIRGVETARYRLRKKFGLTGEQSLVQFLTEFKADE